jgi:hypothetical protein
MSTLWAGPTGSSNWPLSDIRKKIQTATATMTRLSGIRR